MSLNIQNKFFFFILDLFNRDNINNEELQIVREVIILSQTFYYEYKGIIKNKIIYLYEKLKSKKIFQSNEFWKKYLEYHINEEINKKNKEQNNKLTEEQIQNLITNFAYSPMVNIVLNMKKIGLKKSQIKIFIHDSFEKYNIPEKHKKMVNSVIKSK